MDTALPACGRLDGSLLVQEGNVWRSVFLILAYPAIIVDTVALELSTYGHPDNWQLEI